MESKKKKRGSFWVTSLKWKEGKHTQTTSLELSEWILRAHMGLRFLSVGDSEICDSCCLLRTFDYEDGSNCPVSLSHRSIS